MKRTLVTLLIVTGLTVGAPVAEAQSSNIVKLQQQIDFLKQQIHNLMTIIAARPDNTGREGQKTETEWNKQQISRRSNNLELSSGKTFKESNKNADISYSRDCLEETVQGDAESTCMADIQFLNETELVREKSGCGNIEPDISTDILERHGLDLSGDTGSVCVKTEEGAVYKIKTDNEAKQLLWIEK